MERATSAGLEALPAPLLARVCLHLDAHDVLLLAATCRALSSTASSSEVWSALSARDFPHLPPTCLPSSKKRYYHTKARARHGDLSAPSLSPTVGKTPPPRFAESPPPLPGERPPLPPPIPPSLATSCPVTQPFLAAMVHHQQQKRKDSASGLGLGIGSSMAVDHHPLEHPPSTPAPRPPSGNLTTSARSQETERLRNLRQSKPRPVSAWVTRRDEQAELTAMFANEQGWQTLSAAPRAAARSGAAPEKGGPVDKSKPLFDDVDPMQGDADFIAGLRKSQVKREEMLASSLAVTPPMKEQEQVTVDSLHITGRKRRDTAGRLNIDSDMKRKLSESLAAHGKGSSSNSKTGSIVKKSQQSAEQTAKLVDELAEGSPVAANLEFGRLLEQPDCKDLRQSVESFFKTFEKQTKGNDHEEERVLKAFLATTEKAMRSRSIWARLPAKHFVIAKEEMHKFVYSRIYNTLFDKKELQQQDAELAAHISKIKPFITPQFLEVDQAFYEHDSITAAVHEFETLDSYVTPFEKLMCIFNSCRILIYILSNGGSAAGADDFLPLLIITVLRANMTSLHSNFSYIARFVEPEEKFGEGYCYYTHLYSAAMYLQSLTPETIQAYQSTSPHGSPSAASSPRPQQQQPPTTKDGAESQSLQFHMEDESVGTAPKPEPQLSDAEFLAGLGFLEATPETLQSTDIPRLLAEYRRLAEMARSTRPKELNKDNVCSTPELIVTSAALPEGTQAPTALTLANSCAWLGLSDGTVVLVGLPDCSVVCSLRAFDDSQVRSLAVSRSLLWASAAGRNLVNVIDLASLAVLRSVTPLPGDTAVRCLAAAPDGTIWAAGAGHVAALKGSGDGSIKLRAPVQYSISSLVPQRTAVWASCDTGHVVSLNPESGSLMMVLMPFGKIPAAPLLSCSGQSLWASSGSSIVSLNAASGGNASPVTTELQEPVTALIGLASDSEPLFAAAHEGGTTRVMSSAGPKAECRSALIAVQPPLVSAMSSPTPAGGVCWAAISDSRLILWSFTPCVAKDQESQDSAKQTSS